METPETADKVLKDWFYAAGNGDIAQMQQLLNDNTIPVDVVNEAGQTALHIAIVIQNLDIVSLLVSAGADINHRGLCRSVPLHLAANVNSPKLVSWLLCNGAEATAARDDGTTALHCACQIGDGCDVASILLLNAASLLDGTRKANAGITGITVLHDAAEFADLQTVRLLLNNKIDVNAVTSVGITALHIAAKLGYTDIAAELVSQGARLDVLADDAKGNSVCPLHYAAENGHLAAAVVLINSGTDVNICRSYAGREHVTSLHLAAMKRNVDVVRHLLTISAIDINASDSDKATALHVAARAGFSDIAELLLQHGADINIGMTLGQSSNQTALHCAVRCRHVDLTRMLLDAGADVNATEKMAACKVPSEDCENGHGECLQLMVDGYTSLHWAVENGDLENASLLLQHGADANIAASFDKHSGITPLHLASQDGYSDIVWELLQVAGCQLDPLKRTENRDNITPLHQAVYNGHVNTARLLIEHGCDVNWQAGNGYSALHYAAQQGNIELTRLMLQRGGNVQLEATAGDQRRITCLHLAVQSGSTDVLNALLDTGANIDAGKTMGHVSGVTALHQAVYQDKLAIAEALLERGASVDMSMSGWYSPLHVGAERGSARIVDLLLKYNADVNAVARLHDHTGLTAVHVAAQHGHSDIIMMLVSAGSHTEAVRSFGDRSQITALHLAAENGYLGAIRTLLELGANVNARDSLGFTALHLAAQYEFPDVVRFLISAGADTRVKTHTGLTVSKLAEQCGNVHVFQAYMDEKKKLATTSKSFQHSQRDVPDKKHGKKHHSHLMSLLCGLSKR